MLSILPAQRTLACAPANWEGYVPSQVRSGNLALEVIATQSGGLALNSGNDIAAKLQQCVDDTRA
jgi:hypothetical protein